MDSNDINTFFDRLYSFFCNFLKVVAVIVVIIVLLELCSTNL